MGVDDMMEWFRVLVVVAAYGIVAWLLFAGIFSLVWMNKAMGLS